MSLTLELKDGVLKRIDDPEDIHPIYSGVNLAILTIYRKRDDVPINYDVSEATFTVKYETKEGYVAEKEYKEGPGIKSLE